MGAVEEAFRWARIEAARHMASSEAARLRWSEPTITEIVLARAAREVAVVPFTQRAEALSGADWVWWWVDGTAAYGMLVQAKRLTITGTTWSFGFDYKSVGASRSQREVLRGTAATLGLVPAYALYLGTGRYRHWERCPDDHRSGRCLSCVKRTVSLMPEQVASDLVANDAGSVYEMSVALEDLWAPPTAAALLSPLLAHQLVPELRDFLQQRQDGTRAVTRALIDRVLRSRAGAFSATSETMATLHLGEHDRLGPVFAELPNDTGHWEEPYFPQLLGPLRQAPPDYVLGVITGDYNAEELAERMPQDVAGVIVVRVPPQG